MPSSYAIFYDPSCAFCSWCRGWIEEQQALSSFTFLDCHGEHASMLSGSPAKLGREVVVLGPDGEVWEGTDAYLVCLWMLKDYRWLSEALGSLLLYGIAASFFEFLTNHRKTLGIMMGLPSCEGHCEARLHPKAPYR